VSGEPKPGWRVVRGTVDAAKAAAEYERVKAMLPPGVEPTLEDLRRVNARGEDYRGTARAPRAEAARKAAARAPGSRGPRPMTTREAVDAMRRQLVDDSEPSGERPIAKRLGVSRDAVRYALGKDRRRPRV
jgi:hypothetical protein